MSTISTQLTSEARGRVPDLVIIMSLAVFATAGNFFVVSLAFQPEQYLYQIFFERSWVQYATVLVFWITIATLMLHHVRFRREHKAYRRAKEIIESDHFDRVLTWTDAPALRDLFLAEEDVAHHRSIIFTRVINALERLRKSQTTKALEDYFSSRSDYSANRLDTEQAGVRFCVWMIPTLGFVGTVMGIGLGIAGFASVIETADDFTQVKQALPMVTGQLGTAFDTTLLALGCSAITVFYMSFLLKRQEELLANIDSLCFDDVASVFQEHSPDSENLIRAIRDNTEQVLRLMNGNRGALETVIQHELPALGLSLQEVLVPLIEQVSIVLGEYRNERQAIIHLLQVLQTSHASMTEPLQSIQQELLAYIQDQRNARKKESGD